MKNRKINVEEVCKTYNKAREQNVGVTLTPTKVKEILKSFGISESLAVRMMANKTLFTSFKREGKGKGNCKGYLFSYTPVYIKFFEHWIYPPTIQKSKDSSFEKECVDFLKEKGYQLTRIVGFDEEKFAQENPELYKKYLIYETL